MFAKGTDAIFCGDVSPATRRIEEGFTRSDFARTLKTSTFAAPRSGGAATAIFKRSPRRPMMRLRDAPGTTFSATQTRPFLTA